MGLYLGRNLLGSPSGGGAGAAVESTIASQNSSDADAAWMIQDNDRFSAQQFVPSATKEVVALMLKHYDDAAITGTYQMAIQVDVAGEPSGVDICSGTFDATAIDNSLPGAFQRYDFSLTGQVIGSGLYWIVGRSIGMTGSGNVSIAYDSGNPDAATDYRISTNAGVTWNAPVAIDLAYQVIGSDPATGGPAEPRLGGFGF